MGESSIRVETDGPVAIATMARGSANALDTTMCRDLVACFGELRASGHRAVVLTGQGSIFCAGVDLLRITRDGPDYVGHFMPALTDAFLAVFNSPIPVIAAVNGHAIAGGCILVSACDRRVMNADRGRIGVTELLVGVPFPAAAMEIMRFAVGTHRVQELAYLGRTYPAQEAVGRGLVDEVCKEESVLARAVEIAVGLAALPPDPLSHTRKQIRAPVAERIERDRAGDEVVHRMWQSPEVQQAIQSYVNRVLRRA